MALKITIITTQISSSLFSLIVSCHHWLGLPAPVRPLLLSFIPIIWVYRNQPKPLRERVTHCPSLSAFTWHSRKPNYWVNPTMIGFLRCMYTPDPDRIGFLIVELKHPDYSIDSCITSACIRSSGSDRILHSAQARDFYLGPWAGSRRTAAATSFLRNHRKKECHCAPSLCNYHVALSRSSYAIFLECRGSCLIE